MASIFLEDIQTEADAAFDGGRINNLSDLACTIGAIVISALATILAVTKAPAWATAGAAALPALCGTLQTKIDFRGRSAWYFVKYGKLTELTFNVRATSEMPDTEVATKFGSIVSDMENRWAEFVKGGSPPPSAKKPTVPPQ